MLSNVPKSVILTNNGKFVVTEAPLKSPQNGEVTVDIVRAGVCSSDIDRSFNNGAYHYPLVMGHELAGKVSSTSTNNDSFSVGDRVAVFPLLPCFVCSSCEHQHYALCKQYSYYGSRQDGGFANQLNVNVWNLMKLPDGVSFDDAALIEPMAVVLHAIKKLDLSHQQNHKICIIGAGFLGLLAVMLIRQEFPDLEITLIDRNPEKLAIGAQYNDENGNNSGHVRVYNYKLPLDSSGTWEKNGEDIDGEATGDNSGDSVSLSSDGTIVAIGAYGNNGNGTESGHVRVYQYNSGTTTWVQLGPDIDGENLVDFSGISVSLNSNGTVAAIGATHNNGKIGRASCRERV